MQLFGGLASGYTEFNLLVGKDFRVAKWLNFETFTGVGIIEFSSNGRYLQSGIAVGFPAVINTKFNFNKHFGFGIGCFVNFSQITFNYAVTPMFHYRF